MISYKINKVESYKVKMKKGIKRKINNQSGAAMLTVVVFFLFISLAIIGGLVTPSVREFRNANNLIKSRQSFFLSESGLEDAYFRLKNAISVESSTSITLNSDVATTDITDSDYNEKKITTLGDVSFRQRKNELILSTGTGISFNYGIQSGAGGFIIGNATVNGNVYSNGNIIGNNGATVTGSAFAAGISGVIDNIDVGEDEVGDGWAHIVTDSTIAGNLYCQTGSGNNISCDTSRADPSVVDMPITQLMIDQWKLDSEEGETIAGNFTVSSPATLGPAKITGNLAINANLTITGTVYVMGNITTNNGAHISLSGSYGSAGGIIIVDGRVVLSNNVQFFGSGGEESYVLLISTSDCPNQCSGLNAIEILNNVGAIIINAQYGTVHIENNVNLNEVVGEQIVIDNNAEVNYISGLANASFISGPSGEWNVKSWKEIE